MPWNKETACFVMVWFSDVSYRYRLDIPRMNFFQKHNSCINTHGDELMLCNSFVWYWLIDQFYFVIFWHSINAYKSALCNSINAGKVTPYIYIYIHYTYLLIHTTQERTGKKVAQLVVKTNIGLWYLYRHVYPYIFVHDNPHIFVQGKVHIEF